VKNCEFALLFVFQACTIARFYLATMYAANPALSYSRISEWAALHIRRRFIQPMNVQRAAFSQNLTKSEAALPGL
jgi:hypothetical protein